jgi:hypothetical protein
MRPRRRSRHQWFSSTNYLHTYKEVCVCRKLVYQTERCVPGGMEAKGRLPICSLVRAPLQVCVCVCVRERERERVCAFMCVCVCLCVCVVSLQGDGTAKTLVRKEALPLAASTAAVPSLQQPIKKPTGNRLGDRCSYECSYCCV